MFGFQLSIISTVHVEDVLHEEGSVRVRASCVHMQDIAAFIKKEWPSLDRSAEASHSAMRGISPQNRVQRFRIVHVDQPGPLLRFPPLRLAEL